MLAHELRNPLAAIGNAALVARSPGSNTSGSGAWT
jgi:nitrogen-specific signal transduction histidine kinase